MHNPIIVVWMVPPYYILEAKPEILETTSSAHKTPTPFFLGS